jgi:hypothetical protein
MASIERNGKGWRVRWREQGRKGPVHSAQCSSKIDASELRRAIERRQILARTIDHHRPAPPLADLVERWLDTNRGAAGYKSKAAGSLSRLFARKGWAQMADVRAEQLHDLAIADRRYLRAMLRWCTMAGLPADQRVMAYRWPRRKREPKPDLLTDAEVAALAEAAAAWCYDATVLVHLLATYGHRPESLAQAAVNSVDLVNGRWSLHLKSGDLHQHELMPSTIDLLRPLLDRPAESPLLHRHDGQPWRTGQAMAEWWYDSIGKRVVPRWPGIYSLKHYAIGRMQHLGLDLATIAAITGHRDPASLHPYLVSNRTRQRQALNALASLPIPTVSLNVPMK